MSELERFSATELKHELERRNTVRWREERRARARLSVFVECNKEQFVNFFKLAGCKRPEEAVSALLESDLSKVPVAHVEIRHLPECAWGEEEV